MKNRVFPNLFVASFKKHEEMLKKLYNKHSGKNVLELGTGSGNAASLLPRDVCYTGADISCGLLKIAKRAFEDAEIKSALYAASADDLPFADNQFDVIICNLSLNFFADINTVIGEIKRTLKSGGCFIASVPAAERNTTGRTVRGLKLTNETLRELFSRAGFLYEAIEYVNGALLYFKAEYTEED